MAFTCKGVGDGGGERREMKKRILERNPFLCEIMTISVPSLLFPSERHLIGCKTWRLVAFILSCGKADIYFLFWIVEIQDLGIQVQDLGTTNKIKQNIKKENLRLAAFINSIKHDRTFGSARTGVVVSTPMAVP